jgi:hypothetical protein
MPGQTIARSLKIYLRQLIRALVLLLLAGVVISVAVAWGLAYFGWVPLPTSRTSFSAANGDEWRSVLVEQAPGYQHIELVRGIGLSWSPTRATGAPDTTGVGDFATAWASATPDGQREWLELDFPKPVTPVTVMVYETNAPGAIHRVSTFNADGEEQVRWMGVDPVVRNPRGVPVSNIPLSNTGAINRIRLHLDSPAVAGWNEIDAVALVDAAGEVTYASAARASSTYAGLPSGGTSFAELDRTLPGFARRYWTTLDTPQGSGEKRVVMEALGWPWPAMGTTGTTLPSVPSPALISSVRLVGRPRPAAVSIPLTPLWSALLLDAGFYGLALMFLYFVTFRLRRYVRESNRLRRGCCLLCGYDLRFDLKAGCPECGWRRLRDDGMDRVTSAPTAFDPRFPPAS